MWDHVIKKFPMEDSKWEYYFNRRNFRESKNSRIFLDKLSQVDKSKKFREINFREWRNWKDFAR